LNDLEGVIKRNGDTIYKGSVKDNLYEGFGR